MIRGFYMSDKRMLGQYFTITNPFETVGFYKWLADIPNLQDETILEPFAGGNNIPKMIIQDEILPHNAWACYDIKPAFNKCPEFRIQTLDTLEHFPQGYNIVITNPPYLARVSASRRGLDYPKTEYDDLYKLCLDVMLKNVPYVAAIIPETFITSGLFHNRIHSIISLTCKMFDDTECPVCLTLFCPEHEGTFKIYRMNECLGDFDKLAKHDIKCDLNIPWKINDPEGEIGAWCIDGTKEPTIRFGYGKDINSKKIKVSSRSLTRVSGLPEDIDLDDFIKECNKVLAKYRKETKDIFMASFKGLRRDGLYRRRLDFATAKQIMSQAVKNLRGAK